MNNIVSTVLTIILVIGVVFFVFNNGDGLGNAIDSGSRNINDKLDNFDYSGLLAPGAPGHSSELSVSIDRTP